MIDIYTVKEQYWGYDMVIKLYGSFVPPNPMRWFCGYVRLPEDHKLYGKQYDEIDGLVTVHGGVTFEEVLDGMGGFYVGFDCAHAGDSPKVQDEAYTLGECKRLVDQLIEL